jgi:hypothetical protein
LKAAQVPEVEKSPTFVGFAWRIWAYFLCRQKMLIKLQNNVAERWAP